MTEINPDVMAQLKRIWSAVNDGTLDRDAVNDALMKLRDLLSGDEEYSVVVEDAADESEDPTPVPRKPRKKR